MEEGKKRISLIDKATDLLSASVENLAKSLSLFITGWFLSKLILDNDGNIEDTKENYSVINELDQAKAGFFTEAVVPFLAGISLVFLNIQSKNKDYFKEVEEVATKTLPPIKDIGEKPVKKPPVSTPVKVGINDCITGAEDEIREAFGFNVTDDEVEINPSGWLANIGDLKTAYDKVRESAMKAVSSKMPMTDFLKILKTEIEGDDNISGLVKAHFRTIVNNVYSEFDRQVQFKTANCLGYRAAIYEGGLIDHSRAFCIERNGEVFTFDEIQKFGTPEDTYGGYSNKSTGDFNGKPDFDYDPFFDMGGHNCRHAYSYIPDRLAIHLRPELKEVFAKNKLVNA